MTVGGSGGDQEASSPSSSSPSESPSCRPLQNAPPGALLTASGPALCTVEHEGVTARQTFHIFDNQTDRKLDVYWVWAGGGERLHGTIAPWSNLYVGSYAFHEWKVLDSASGRVIATHTGESATITLRPRGPPEVRFNQSDHTPPMVKHATAAAAAAAGLGTSSTAGAAAATLVKASGGGGGEGEGEEASQVLPWGRYLQRSEPLPGFAGIFACEGVAEEAVICAGHVARKVLECCPREVVENLREAGASLGIVCKGQGITDLPPHRFMKLLQGRDLDRTCRGLGGTPSVPMTVVGEENLTLVDDRVYPCCSILIHELGHAVLNMGVSKDFQHRLVLAYQQAQSFGLYPASSYLMTNEQEYWAVLTEAWFESTIRTDINAGINTREKLKSHDVALARLFREAFGEGAWRFVHDCPAKLRMPSREDYHLAAQDQGSVMSDLAAAAISQQHRPDDPSGMAGVLDGVRLPARSAGVKRPAPAPPAGTVCLPGRRSRGGGGGPPQHVSSSPMTRELSDREDHGLEEGDWGDSGTEGDDEGPPPPPAAASTSSCFGDVLGSLVPLSWRCLPEEDRERLGRPRRHLKKGERRRDAEEKRSPVAAVGPFASCLPQGLGGGVWGATVMGSKPVVKER